MECQFGLSHFTLMSEKKITFDFAMEHNLDRIYIWNAYEIHPSKLQAQLIDIFIIFSKNSWIRMISANTYPLIIDVDSSHIPGTWLQTLSIRHEQLQISVRFHAIICICSMKNSCKEKINFSFSTNMKNVSVKERQQTKNSLYWKRSHQKYCIPSGDSGKYSK